MILNYLAIGLAILFYALLRRNSKFLSILKTYGWGARVYLLICTVLLWPITVYYLIARKLSGRRHNVKR